MSLSIVVVFKSLKLIHGLMMVVVLCSLELLREC